MHLVQASNPEPAIPPLFFNVDQPVGEDCMNLPEDVFLVQFLLRKIAQRGTKNPDRTARMLAVPVSGVCDDATVDGIQAVQEAMQEVNPATVVDGRVSRAQSSGGYGGGVWTIVTLNQAMRDKYPEIWPRLQDLGDCPGPVKAKVPKLL